MDNSNKKIIKVKSTTSVPQLSGSIHINVCEGLDVELRAMGAGAVCQMIKGLASARGTLAAKDKNLFIQPGFDDVIEDGEKKTVVTARVVIL